MRFDIRVQPRASRTGIAGVRDGRLIVRVTAPPVDDAANEAVRECLADALAIRVRDVAIVTGAHGRSKTVEVSGVDTREILRRLEV